MDLKGSVSPAIPVSPADVRRLKAALNRLGYYTPREGEGLTAEPDALFFLSLRAFQYAHAIPATGAAGPGSATARVLEDEIARQDAKGFYIWRTAGDEKVRGAHAARAGRRFQWGRPPGGGHPGEDYNCRCWAEPLAPVHNPWIEWVSDQRRQMEAQEFAARLSAPAAPLPERKPEISYPDAINPALSPLDFVGGGFAVAGRTATKILLARFRDTSWIWNAGRWYGS